MSPDKKAAIIDPELVKRAQGGDAGAFGSIYEALQDRIRGYHNRYNNNNNFKDADDLTSETFLRVLCSLGKYDPRRGIEFEAWVFAVARNLAIDTARRQSAGERAYDRIGEPPTASPSSEDEYFARAIPDDLRNALNTLTDRQKRVIEVRVIGGQTLVGTGKVLGWSKSSVNAHQRNGLRRLRELLPRDMVHDNSKP